MTASALANNLPVLTSTWDSSLSNSAMPTGTQFANGFVDNVDNITAEAYNYLHGASTGLVWLGQLLGLAQPFNPDVSGNSKVAVPSGGIVTLKNSVSGATEWYVALNSRSTGFTDPSLDVTNWTLINFAVLAKSPPVYADNTGTSEALLAVYVNVAYPVLVDGFPVTVGIVTPNTGNTVTLQVNLNGSLKNADSCVKFINNIAYPLVPGDLQGDSMFARDAPNTRWVLQNPADTTKPGETIEWTGPTAPTGYLQCPVAQTLVSTTTYAALFAAIGYTWGGAGGSFGLPFYPAGYVSAHATSGIGTNTAGAVIAHGHTTVANSTGGGISGSTNTDHTHTYLYVPNGGGSANAGGGALNNTTTATGTGAMSANANHTHTIPTLSIPSLTVSATGGSANLAASVYVMKCVKF